MCYGLPIQLAQEADMPTTVVPMEGHQGGLAIRDNARYGSGFALGLMQYASNLALDY